MAPPWSKTRRRLTGSGARYTLSGLLPLALIILLIAAPSPAAPAAGRPRPAAPAAAPAAPEAPPVVYKVPQQLMPAKAVQRAKPLDPPPADWQKAPFYCLQTELSPATLYHTTGQYLAFFTGMKDFGLGGPTYAAFDVAGEPRVVKAGEAMDPTLMGECWVLVWFAGAEGWTDWDSPWVIYLEKRPSKITLTAAGGLTMKFDSPAGTAVLLPLYGYEKPPQGKDAPAAADLPPSAVHTWTWAAGLPKDVVTRIRYWAGVLREFPVYCEDSFSVDRSRSTVTIRQRFDWFSIKDDWQTPHLKLAPVSPPLAQAAAGGQFPVSFSKPLSDPGMATPYGPYMGIEDVDTYDANLQVLKCVNEVERTEAPDLPADPVTAAALDRLRATAAAKFPSPDKYLYDHGGMDNFCWAIQGDGAYAKALPFLEDATRTTAAASLQKYFRDDVLVPARFIEREFPERSGHLYLVLEGPGITSGGGLGDAGKFSTDMLETLWNYAHFTGDWELIRVRWPLVRQLFCTAAETRWATFGRGTVPELGDEAAPCLAMARMAYVVGDMDTYNYACSLFAREIVVQWDQSRGSPYFRARQPWNSTEVMPEEVYPTNLWGDTAGWQLDGPAYPKVTSERQFANRWVRFKNEDVARFYRENLAADVRKEMDLLTGRWDAKRRFTNDSAILPSLVQLRSLLLNESPMDLAKVATPDQFAGPSSGILASCLAVLRTSHATHFDRLFASAPATGFFVGLEREVAGANPFLVQAILSTTTEPDTKTDRAAWPLLTWQGWKTPSGYNRWTFGTVRPVELGDPAEARSASLNWNTRAVIYTMPSGM